MDAQLSAKSAVKQLRREQSTLPAEKIKQRLTTRTLDLASERGASNWLTSLPISEFGFSLHKGTFVDALCLRYGWTPGGTPIHCDQLLGRARPRFPSIRHNEIMDITADLLTEICHDVSVEPDLKPLTGETLAHRTANISDGARLDVSMKG